MPGPGHVFYITGGTTPPDKLPKANWTCLLTDCSKLFGLTCSHAFEYFPQGWPPYRVNQTLRIATEINTVVIHELEYRSDNYAKYIDYAIVKIGPEVGLKSTDINIVPRPGVDTEFISISDFFSGEFKKDMPVWATYTNSNQNVMRKTFVGKITKVWDDGRIDTDIPVYSGCSGAPLLVLSENDQVKIAGILSGPGSTYVSEDVMGGRFFGISQIIQDLEKSYLMIVPANMQNRDLWDREHKFIID